jgi:hypothetical protein
MNDDTLDRLRRLNARLAECLVDAADARARLTRAQDDTTDWPDLRLKAGLLRDTRSPSQFRASGRPSNRGY